MTVATFVLVHPAWHGGWCWNRLAPILRQHGTRVFTPTLTGLGERTHLAGPGVGLDTHVTDIVNVLEYEELHDVILVGHSSSGAVITGVTDRIPERIAQLVYLDAFVPEDGQSVFDLVSPERRQMMEALAIAEGHGWLLPRFAAAPWETIVREMWGVHDAADVRWLLDHLAPTPLKHFVDPVRRANPAAERVPRTFVRCRRFTNPRFDRHAELARQGSPWRYREMDASHHPAITAPDALADLLLELRSVG